MGRRVTELSQSPTRLRMATNAAMGHSRSTSGGSGASSSPQLTEKDVSLSPLPWEAVAGELASKESSADLADTNVFTTFLRRTTCLSCSSTTTTGSFARVLSGYSQPYVQTVKRLVKRFTAPVPSSRQSPFEDAPSVEEDAAPELGSDLPGNFLFLDSDTQHTGQNCFGCMHLDDCVLPWVNCEGITETGFRLLTSAPTPQDVNITDTFGNTLLHFLAARGSVEQLTATLQHDFCQALARHTNSAGQTFLHVLHPRIAENLDYVRELLTATARWGCELGARDVYGRSVFHILQAQHGHSAIRSILDLCDARTANARDAFGATITQHHAITDDTNISESGYAHERTLLAYVRLAKDNHLLENAEGRNGLHCLALAKLSTATVATKHQNAPPPPTSPHTKLDSHPDRMQLRRGLAVGLLEAGVDPNQRDRHGNTPLMAFAAELPEDNDYKVGREILARLVEAGADVHARNRRGETALHVAVRKGRKLAVRALCEASANVHVRDSAGRSLLDVADIKMARCCAAEQTQTAEYAHYEACRAWLSGRACALQRPSVRDEWAV